MTTALEPQIRKLSQAFDATIDPVSVDEVLEGIETTAPVRRRSPRSSWVAVAALAAVMLLPLILLANRWFSDEAVDDPAPTSTTIENSPTTTMPTTVGSLPLAATVGWTFAEVEMPVERGRLSVGWSADGAPLVTTAGFHCVDVDGDPKWNYSNSFSPGAGCAADGDATGDFVGHEWVEGTRWTDHPAFPGKMVYPDGVIGGLTNQIVCEPGSPSNPECSYWASLDGVNWFQSEQDGDTYHSMLHGEWSRDANDVMVQVVAGEPGEVIWYVSTDGGRTFPDRFVGSDIEHAAVFTVDGRHRLLMWVSGQTEPTLHEYDGVDGWRPIGPVSGLPKTANLCTIDNCGPTARAYRVEDGTIWLAATVGQFASGDTLFYSTDSGATWTEPSPGTPERPFASIDPTDVHFVDGWLVVRPAGDYHAVTQGTQWYRVPAEWFDSRDPSPSRPTTFASVPIPPGSATSTLETEGSDESPPSVVTAGLPQGWRIVELRLDRDEGTFRWVYGPDGLPRVLSTGFHCVDDQGDTRINDAADDGYGDACTGALVETPTAMFYVATPSGDWVEYADPFDGHQAILFSSSPVLTQAVVCPPGTTGDLRHTCSVTATDDGTAWYVPLGDDGPVALTSHDPLVGGDRIDGSILVPAALPGNTPSGQRRTPTGVQWLYSSDGGRTFSVIATEPAAVTEAFGIATHFIFNGAFRSIIWDDTGDATLRELDEDLIWQPIGNVSGLPGPGASEPWAYFGGTRLLGTASGAVFMVDLRADEDAGTLKRISHDGGLTWIELEPMTSDMPFTTGRDIRVRQGVPYIPWATRIGGWLLLNTDQGLYLTDGEMWHLIPGDAVSIEWGGESKRDPVTIRLPALIDS